MPYNVKEHGAYGDGSHPDTAAIRAALQTAGSVYLPEGTYLVDVSSSAGGSFELLDGQQVFGDGYKTIIKRSDTSSNATFSLGLGRNIVREMTIEGVSSTTYSGVGIVVGLFNFSGVHKIRDVRARYFDAGIRHGGALWTSLYSCRFEDNNYGETYDVQSGVLNRHSTTVAHYSCAFMNSKKSGVAGINVPMHNRVLSYYSCTFQDNGSTNTPQDRHPQVKLGLSGSVVFNCCYFQYSNSNPPDSMDITGIGEFQIANSYFNGGEKHIIATAQIDNGLISCNRFLGTTGTKAVDLQIAANARIHAVSNVTDKPIYLGGGSTTTIITSKIKQVP